MKLAKKEAIAWAARQLTDHLDELEAAMTELPIDYGDRRDHFEAIIAKLLNKKS